MAHIGVSRIPRSYFGGPYARDPVVLGPYHVPLFFGSSHLGQGQNSS